MKEKIYIIMKEMERESRPDKALDRLSDQAHSPKKSRSFWK